MGYSGHTWSHCGPCPATAQAGTVPSPTALGTSAPPPRSVWRLALTGRARPQPLVARQRHISGVISVVISGNVVGGCWLVINSPTGRSGSRGRQPGPGQQAASSRLTKGSMQAGKGQQFSDVVCLQNGRRGFIYKSSSELSPSSTPPPSCRSASSPPAPMSPRNAVSISRSMSTSTPTCASIRDL